jgi:hypothetical protein
MTITTNNTSQMKAAMLRESLSITVCGNSNN